MMTSDLSDLMDRSEPAAGRLAACEEPREPNRHTTSDPALERLAAACTALRRLCPEVPVVAIHWLNIKYPPHPVQRELLQGLDRDERQGTDAKGGLVLAALQALWRCAQCFAYAGYLSVVLMWLRWCVRRELAILTRRPFDVIGKTWGYGVARSGEAPDFYYGDLQQRLAARGVRMLLLYGEGGFHSPRLSHWRTFARAHVSVSEAPRLPELCLVHPLRPFHVALAQLQCAWRLRRAAARLRDPLLRRMAQRAAGGDGCLARQTMRNALFFWIGRAAVRTWRPRAGLVLYEGYSWEQCAWWGMKSTDPSCRTIGYQHSIVLPNNLALRFPRDPGQVFARPDIVCCLGPSTQAMLEGSHSGSTLIPFGSFRRTPEEAAGRPTPERRTVLVVPEGLDSEAKLLFDAALRLASRLPDHTFILRCHPALPFAEMRASLADAPERHANVHVSARASMDDDVARSSVVLYRGSAAVLHAALQGLKPIYLRDIREPDVDPLAELRTWRESVSSVEEAALALTRYAAAGAAAGAQWAEVAALWDGYLAPVTERSIDALLAALGDRDA